ncbi:caspase family protein [Rhodopirellula sallentina]|uniref:caspase family protein n=1 Tax=Rhodopirellula sallentina TaxID=1263869 RepID=UPI001360B5F4|nr:caspase family protein [Rhodopirellula sallentina]
MKANILFLAFSAIILLVVATSVVTAGDPIALVIGNKNYKQGPLRACIKDANAFRDWLLSSGYASEDIDLVHDATGDDIRSALARLARHAAEEKPSHVTFYFSGHGGYTRDLNGDEAPPDDQDEFLSGVDNDRGRSSMVLDDTVYATLADVSLHTKQIMVVFDSCFSGGSAKSLQSSAIAKTLSPGVASKSLLAQSSSPNHELDEIFQLTEIATSKSVVSDRCNFIFVAASDESQTSQIVPDLELSLFTHYFLERLRSTPRNATLKMLESALRTDMRGLQTPEIIVRGSVSPQKFSLQQLFPVRGDVDPGRHAILIGVNSFDDPSIVPLNYAARDAQAVRTTLLENCAFDEANIRMAASGGRIEPTLSNVRALTSRIASEAKENSFVLFYFSGHGHINPGQSGVLVTKDAVLDPSENSVAQAYPINELHATFRACRAKHKILVLDCCHAAANAPKSVARQATATPGQIANLLETKQTGDGGYIVFASSTGDQKSWEWPQKRSSLFTHFFCEGLRGAADRESGDRKGSVDFSELFKYVSTNVQRTAKTPELGERIQTPYQLVRVSGVNTLELSRVSGDIVLAIDWSYGMKKQQANLKRFLKLISRKFNVEASLDGGAVHLFGPSGSSSVGWRVNELLAESVPDNASPPHDQDTLLCLEAAIKKTGKGRKLIFVTFDPNLFKPFSPQREQDHWDGIEATLRSSGVDAKDIHLIQVRGQFVSGFSKLLDPENYNRFTPDFPRALPGF